MIEIEKLGGNTVAISSKVASVVVNTGAEAAKKLVKLTSAIEISTDKPLDSPRGDQALRVDGPGEYEVADFTIRGARVSSMVDPESSWGSTVYGVRQADINIALVGGAKLPLDDDTLEVVGIVDILLVYPVSEASLVDLVALVKVMEPKVVVPVGLATDYVSKFATDLGATYDSSAKVKFKNAAALPESLAVYELA